jgi:hypothetical protein
MRSRDNGQIEYDAFTDRLLANLLESLFGRCFG